MSADGKGSDPRRGEISPEDREAIRKRAAELGKRLDQVKERRELAEKKGRRPTSDTSGMAQAIKVAAELVVGVGVGAFIGWWLDRQLATAPWLMVLFLVLGFAAGLLNVVRSARRLQARNEAAQRAAPAVREDDDD
jgi:ATP synthase protein I